MPYVPPGEAGIRVDWDATCSPVPEPEEPAYVEIVDVHVEPREPEASSLVMRAELNTEPESSVTVTDVRVFSNGLGVGASGLPVELSAKSPAELELTWSVISCAEAEQFDRLDLSLRVEGLGSSGNVRWQEVWLPDRVLMELMRFIAYSCPG